MEEKDHGLVGGVKCVVVERKLAEAGGVVMLLAFTVDLDNGFARLASRLEPLYAGSCGSRWRLEVRRGWVKW